MNIELLFRIPGLAVLFASILSFVAFLAKRNSLYKKGRNLTELETSVKESVMSKKVVGEEMKKRMAKDPAASVFHHFIMLGFILSLLAHVFSILNRTLMHSINIEVVQKIFFILTVFSILGGGILIFIGSLHFIIRRLSGKQARFSGSASDIIPLLVLLSIAVFGLVYNFALVKAEDPFLLTISGINWFLILSRLFHVLSIALFIFYIPKSKLFHIVAAHMLAGEGVFLLTGRIKDSVGMVNKQFIVTDSEGEDNDDSIGIGQIFDFTKKQLMALDACTSCGRCEDVCPAYLSQKSLSPKKMMKTQKKYFNENTGKQPQILTEDTELVAMANECTMCYACEQACPSFIEQVDKIVDIRRHRALEDGTVPSEWKDIIKNCEKTSNIFGNDVNNNLCNELDLPVYKSTMDVDYLLWIGCYGHTDPRMKSVVASLAGLLKNAGKSFALLEKESCCGEMLRTVGEEYQFQVQAYKNVEQLNNTGKSTILAICPHCYHTLKKEYSGFGLQKKVLHYTEILPEILDKNSAEIETAQPLKIAYHDSCYLCRLNGITEEPREVIKNLGNNIQLVALNNEKEDSLCCGGGGGRVVMDEEVNQRVALIKMREVVSKNIDIVATSCPYCLNIFSDAAAYLEYGGKVIDLSELVSMTKLLSSNDKDFNLIEQKNK